MNIGRPSPVQVAFATPTPFDGMHARTVEALASPAALSSQWAFAEYLDAAVFSHVELQSVLYQSVMRATSTFIEANLHSTRELADLGERSWAYRELIDAELDREAVEITLDFEAIPVEAVEVLSRVAALGHCEAQCRPCGAQHQRRPTQKGLRVSTGLEIKQVQCN